MPSPLPGMDPYLESPRFWSDLHGRFIPYAAEMLGGQLSARYRARVSEWLVLASTGPVMIPDVTVVQRPAPSGSAGVATVEADEPTIFGTLTEDLKQTTLEIVDRSGEQVVTAIELLSPINKARGEGSWRYQDKQRTLQRSGANLVEIDLLSGGEHVLAIPPAVLAGEQPYYSLVNTWRAASPGRFEVYFIRLEDRLPRIRVPLLPTDPDVVLDLQSLLTRCYDAARYDLDVDYTSPPPVALPESFSHWVATYLAQRRSAT